METDVLQRLVLNVVLLFTVVDMSCWPVISTVGMLYLLVGVKIDTKELVKVQQNLP